MKIRANGEALFNVIININELTEEELIEKIHKLAIEVSEERVNAESRIVAMSFCEPRSCIGRLSS